jgi:hypothetical protein
MKLRKFMLGGVLLSMITVFTIMQIKENTSIHTLLRQQYHDKSKNPEISKPTTPPLPPLPPPTPPPPPPPPPHHHGILQALQWFDEKVSLPFNLKYRLAYGSLLGYERNKKVIQHDTDIDIVVSIDSLNILKLLVENNSESKILDQRFHKPLSSFKTSKHEDDRNNIVLLFRSTNHNQPFHKVPRIDCNGNIQESNVDACSFTGPIARVLHLGTATFVDIFLTKCKYHKEAATTYAKTWHCRESTNDCTYCPSTHAIQDLSLNNLQRCQMNGIVNTWCPPKKWSENRLERIYGNDWRVVNKKAVYSNTAWKE